MHLQKDRLDLVWQGLLWVYRKRGNYPGAVKTIAEWFPKKERALATGIAISGTNIGAIIAPIVVPLIAVTFGWQWAFIITGAIGLVWLVFWQVLYNTPGFQLAKQRLKQAEYDHILSDKEETVAADGSEFKKVELVQAAHIPPDMGILPGQTINGPGLVVHSFLVACIF